MNRVLTRSSSGLLFDHPIESKNPKDKNFGFERCARKVSYVVPRSEDIDLK